MTEAQNLRELNERLGIDIDPETLRLSLTHRSYAFENGGIPTNERLEFLGDSVLQLVATEWLFHNNPAMAEGRLAKMRSAVVNTRALAAVARQYGIGDYLLLGKGEEAHRRTQQGLDPRRHGRSDHRRLLHQPGPAGGGRPRAQVR